MQSQEMKHAMMDESHAACNIDKNEFDNKNEETFFTLFLCQCALAQGKVFLLLTKRLWMSGRQTWDVTSEWVEQATFYVWCVFVWLRGAVGSSQC